MGYMQSLSPSETQEICNYYIKYEQFGIGVGNRWLTGGIPLLFVLQI